MLDNDIQNFDKKVIVKEQIWIYIEYYKKT